jgi:hypothetical protein
MLSVIMLNVENNPFMLSVVGPIYTKFGVTLEGADSDKRTSLLPQDFNYTRKKVLQRSPQR